MAKDLSKLLTKPRAMAICEHLRDGAGKMADLIAEFHEGQGWLVLGYATWKDCCEKEFHHSAWWGTNQLRISEVRKTLPPPPKHTPQAKKDKAVQIATQVFDPPLKDSHLIELAKVPEEKRQAVVDWATEKAEGKPMTAAAIKAAAKEVLDAEPPEEEEPEEEEVPKIVDSLKRTVPEHLIPVFQHANQFDKAMMLCTTLTKTINELRADEIIGVVLSGRGIASQALKDIENVRHALKFSKPYSVCPYCKGRGCNACSEFGWVGEGVYRSAPKEKR